MNMSTWALPRVDNKTWYKKRPSRTHGSIGSTDRLWRGTLLRDGDLWSTIVEKRDIQQLQLLYDRRHEIQSGYSKRFRYNIGVFSFVHYAIYKESLEKDFEGKLDFYVLIVQMFKILFKNLNGFHKIGGIAETALTYAIKRNSPGFARILLESGAKTNIAGFQDYVGSNITQMVHPPLYLACLESKSVYAKLLMEHNAETHIFTIDRASSILFWVTCSNSSEDIECCFSTCIDAS